MSDAQVEQDLVISRALVDIFRHEELSRTLAFRGGTALFKLRLVPAARYSEDIDLVQREAGPIGPILDALRAVLEPWLPSAQSSRSGDGAKLIFRFQAEGEPSLTLRLKIEINTREHFADRGFVTAPFVVQNRWYAGRADITTYRLEELLATKLRALYQRRKGRDLFDLWYALSHAQVDGDAVAASFAKYLMKEGLSVSRASFLENLDEKAADPDFRDEVLPLLRAGVDWDFDKALIAVKESLVSQLPR